MGHREMTLKTGQRWGGAGGEVCTSEAWARAARTEVGPASPAFPVAVTMFHPRAHGLPLGVSHSCK